MPAGSGALAGLNWDLDRDGLATELGFQRPLANSLDAVSNRDFALDYLYAASACAMHLSRLGSEIVIWSSREFGFCEPADSFASGSSIMPQKKNPDAAELLRGKGPRVAASLVSLLGTMHALPLAYSKDMQEDKEPLFDAIDTVEVCLEAANAMLAGLSFDRARLAEASADEFLAATDLADALVAAGVPFREAHGTVAGLVRTAVSSGRTLSELDDAEMEGVPGLRARAAPRGAAGERRARVQGLGRRHLVGAPGRAARAGPPQPRRPLGVSGTATAAAGPALGASFFDRSVHEVAPELIGCTLEVGECAGVIVETEAYDETDPACHAFGGPHGPQPRPLRPAWPRLRLPLLRDPQPAERGRGARGQRRRGTDPGTGADRGHRPDARAPRPRGAP